MADIRRYPLVKHLRAGTSAHVIRYRRGKLVMSSRGAAFFFRPLATTVVEVPIDDREQTFLFTGRTADFQDVAVQGVVTFRVADPEVLASRVDFSIELDTGMHATSPMEQLTSIVTQYAQELVLDYLAHHQLRPTLQDGVVEIRDLLDHKLRAADQLAALGIEVVAVRIVAVRPTPEVEKALQTPVREGIQQISDQATFERRAAAVEKERAIAENELANEIELAKRREFLISQEGLNVRRQFEEQSAANRIDATGKAEVQRISAAAEAGWVTETEGAKAEAERNRIEIYRDLPAAVLYGLAARELAGNLPAIEHLTVGSDAFGPMLQRLVASGAEFLEA
ncbi:MAG: SPFH domain-containing protein [Acidimicrobiia bacterium]|nr:SPFH domain-containing protein [Acidimicrobiia bacterium]